MVLRVGGGPCMSLFWGRGDSLHNPSHAQCRGTKTELESSSHGMRGGEPGPRNLLHDPSAIVRGSVQLVLDFSAGHQSQVGDFLGARGWSALCPAD